MNLNLRNKIRRINSLWKSDRNWRHHVRGKQPRILEDIEHERFLRARDKAAKEWKEKNSEKKMEEIFKDSAPVSKDFVTFLIENNYDISLQGHWCGIKIYSASKFIEYTKVQFFFFVHPEMTHTPYTEIIKTPLDSILEDIKDNQPEEPEYNPTHILKTIHNNF